MANCPNCGSTHISLRKDSNVNWGRAVAGWALFGVIGGAVGAITGKDKTANVCLDCGTSWKAKDLYQVLQIVKNSTGINLDLSNEADRLYMNLFVEEIGPFLESLSKAEDKSKKLITEVESEEVTRAASGCGYGCLGSVVLLFTGASVLSTKGAFLVIMVPPLIGVGLGYLTNTITKKSTVKKIETVKLEAADTEYKATENLNFAVRDFVHRHSV